MKITPNNETLIIFRILFFIDNFLRKKTDFLVRGIGPALRTIVITLGNRILVMATRTTTTRTTITAFARFGY